MNLDKDHLSDFKNVMQDCTVPWILSNPTVGPREFAVIKKDGVGPGAQAVAAWLAQTKNPLPGPQPGFGDVQICWYYPFFVPGAENKTNDLSLAVIAQFGAFKILFVGDLEVAGWRRLLIGVPPGRAGRLGVCRVITAGKAGAVPNCFEGCHNIKWVGGEVVIHLHAIVHAIALLGRRLRANAGTRILLRSSPVASR
jgi:hypothetical protein